MSLQTNAKKISYFILVALLVLIGLVGCMSINSPNNIIASAFDNSIIKSDDYALTNIASPSGYTSGTTGCTGTNIYINRGWLNMIIPYSQNDVPYISFYCPSPITVINGAWSYSNNVSLRIKNTKSSAVTMDNVEHFRSQGNTSYFYAWFAWQSVPSYVMIECREYDNQNNNLINHSKYWDTSALSANTWTPKLFNETMSSSSCYYCVWSFQVPANSSLYLSSVYVGNANRSLGEHISTAKDIANLWDIWGYYEGNSALYWHTSYLTSQENLRLAQEEGATFQGALESITTAPINALAEFMEFELPFFNINLGTILAILVSLLLVGFVIKILINKG